jgi:hypothetical protein
MQLTTRLDTYLYCFESTGVRVACPLSVRRFGGHSDIVTPYGLSGFIGTEDCPEFRPAWSDFVRSERYVCGYFALNPLFGNPSYFEPAEIALSNKIYFLDLRLSRERLIANLSSNRRRQIRAGEEEIITERRPLIEFFLANYCDFLGRVGASSVYYFSRETLSYILTLDNVFIIGAAISQKVVAASVFAFTSYAADFLFGISLPGKRQHSAALLWSGAMYLKSVGIPLLNLGGGIRRDDGVAEFKRRFGAGELPLRCLKQIYDPETYAILCQRVKADPCDTTGYFPPYHVPW